MSLIEDGKGKLNPRGLRYTRQAMRKRSLLASPQTVAEARSVKLQQYLYKVRVSYILPLINLLKAVILEDQIIFTHIDETDQDKSKKMMIRRIRQSTKR